MSNDVMFHFVPAGRTIKTDEVSDCAINNPAAALCNGK
jgi:hypothetical protein